MSTGNGQNAFAFKAVYTYSNNAIIEVVPCQCGLSIYCNASGYPYTSSDVVAAYLSANNQIPNIILTPTEETVPLGSARLSLNATPTFDPDNGPGPLTFHWKLLEAPSGETVNITCPTCQVTYIPAASLIAGFYSVVVYVGDGQADPFGIVNFTIQTNVIFSIIAPDYFVTFMPCEAGTASQRLILNGSASYGTDPNITLMYNWTQVGGYLTSPPEFNTVCDNFTSGLFFANESIAEFTPPAVGIYVFNLSVSDDMGDVAWNLTYITVLAPGELGTAVPSTIGEFTRAPIINLTFPPGPTQEFPNSSAPFETFPPNPAAPTTNTSVPPLFPDLPPESMAATGTALFALFVSFFALAVYIALWRLKQPGETAATFRRVRH